MSKLVLIVEDNPILQDIAAFHMKKAGLGICRAADGKEALKHLLEDTFDLILMDIHMPEMDGIETTKSIRKLEETKGLKRAPIIGVTADTEIKNQAFAAGMDDVITKPADYRRIAKRWLGEEHRF